MSNGTNAAPSSSTGVARATPLTVTVTGRRSNNTTVFTI